MILYTTIVSGSAVSADVDLSQYALVAVGVPTVTSGDLYLQGHFNTTSAMFRRLNDDLGDIKFSTGPGSKMVLWPLGFAVPSYVRLETSVTQTDTRTFDLLALHRR